MADSIWDRLRFPIVESDEVSDAKRWELHRDVWIHAFRALGDLHKMDLHEIDSNVTIQPDDPALWFYGGKDADDTATSTELSFAIRADDFNNPDFNDVLIQHWFLIGIGVGRQEIEALASKLGTTLSLPELTDEIVQTRNLYVRIDQKHFAVHGNGADITVRSATDSTPISDLEPYYQTVVSEITESQLCRCTMCLRFRPRVDAIVQQPEWAAKISEIESTHETFSAQLSAVLDTIDGGKYLWALRSWRTKEVNNWLCENGTEAHDILVPRFTHGTACSPTMAQIVGDAFTASKAAQKLSLIPIVTAALSSPDDDCVREMMKKLTPIFKPPLAKKHVTGKLLDALVTLLTRFETDDEMLAMVGRTLCKNLVWKKPKTEDIFELADQLLSHPSAVIRRQATSEIEANISTGLLKLPAYQERYFDMLVKHAQQEFQPEFAPVLSAHYRNLPNDIKRSVRDAIPDFDRSQLDVSSLFLAQKECPELNQPLAHVLASENAERRAYVLRSFELYDNSYIDRFITIALLAIPLAKTPETVVDIARRLTEGISKSRDAEPPEQLSDLRTLAEKRVTELGGDATLIPG